MTVSDEESGPQGDHGGQAGPPDAAPRPPYRGWTAAPTEELYSAMWALYRDGLRGERALARRCGVSRRTIFTAIHRGWPEESWPSLASRLELWERQRDAARAREIEQDKAAAETKGKTEGQLWKDFQRRSQGLVAQAESILLGLGRKLQSAVGAATFVRYRRVRKVVMVDGKPQVHIEDQAYVDGLALAKATHLWTSSVRDVPTVMKVLLGAAALEPQPDAPEFSDEQLEQMARGELPNGVTEQQVGMALLAASRLGGEGDE